ncbi:uncharacterized protein L969DRAFT_606417 [Mixia osmundae IAM 14324]|uniref:Uncharacterized protein n=1 Tax=Mixia osmundae (strain CBS 9802 / IAM 14324 / JCM 22182 / KY 12970) TaxID=764103 RepID=G7E882_MIXOS|nr:uncharacterized protein L969DRAFT_606417 [Mixia osmundae IAM 14324]KEI42366.1 hypothetical protein L969DRAFT_606417 [Mixia osmundae IAM 14324]GAA99042.1 hypothetical protein E5Q_05731 [Mixia osmundae IAM 14324]
MPPKKTAKSASSAGTRSSSRNKSSGESKAAPASKDTSSSSSKTSASKPASKPKSESKGKPASKSKKPASKADDTADKEAGANKGKPASKRKASSGDDKHDGSKKFKDEKTEVPSQGQEFHPPDPQQSFTITAPPPKRDPKSKEFTFHESEHAERLLFHPNLSPEEVLRRGAFGGSYFRPIESKKLGKEFHDDWSDLPRSWFEGLEHQKYLTNPEYDVEVCCFKSKVGQTYEAWEDQGWIKYEHDVRGWFQWYCRFFLGRRCEDDERQMSRWKGIASKSGRFRNTLLNKYVNQGYNDIDPEHEPISPGIRQTLLHWAFDLTTAHLDMHKKAKGLKVPDHGDGEEGDFNEEDDS